MGPDSFSTVEIIQSIAVIVAAAGVIITSIQVFITSKGHIIAKSQTTLNCIKSYIDIRKTRTDAIISKEPEKAKDYYREFIDLFWIEFDLWRKGLVDDNIMRAWIYARSKSYEVDAIKIGEERIVYKEIWKNLEKSGYYSPEDDFVRFINLVHDGQIEKAIKMKSNK